MEKKYSNLNYKEVWTVLSKLPIDIVTKIPFEIRNNIAEQAEKCENEISEINMNVYLSDMNISEESKDMLMALYINYFSDEKIKEKINEYIVFFNRNN